MTDQQPVVRDTSLETLCHLLGLAFLTPIPFGNLLAPLVLWLWKRDTNPGVDLHGKEVVNFQISMSIYMLLAGLSMFIVIGFFLLPAVILTNLVLIIIASSRLKETYAAKDQTGYSHKNKANAREHDVALILRFQKVLQAAADQGHERSCGEGSQSYVGCSESLQKKDCLPFDALRLSQHVRSDAFRIFARFHEEFVHAVAGAEHAIDCAHRQNTSCVSEQSWRCNEAERFEWTMCAVWPDHSRARIARRCFTARGGSRARRSFPK